MDANGNIIPLVEDDQGEGIMDPLDIDEVERLQGRANVLEQQLHESQAQKKAQVILVKLADPKGGDRVGFYAIPEDGRIGLGNQIYKIVRIRSNGSVVLKQSKG